MAEQLTTDAAQEVKGLTRVFSTFTNPYTLKMFWDMWRHRKSDLDKAHMMENQGKEGINQFHKQMQSSYQTALEKSIKDAGGDVSKISWDAKESALKEAINQKCSDYAKSQGLMGEALTERVKAMGGDLTSLEGLNVAELSDRLGRLDGDPSKVLAGIQEDTPNLSKVGGDSKKIEVAFENYKKRMLRLNEKTTVQLAKMQSRISMHFKRARWREHSLLVRMICSPFKLPYNIFVRPIVSRRGHSKAGKGAREAFRSIHGITSSGLSAQMKELSNIRFVKSLANFFEKVGQFISRIVNRSDNSLRAVQNLPSIESSVAPTLSRNGSEVQVGGQVPRPKLGKTQHTNRPSVRRMLDTVRSKHNQFVGSPNRIPNRITRLERSQPRGNYRPTPRPRVARVGGNVAGNLIRGINRMMNQAAPSRGRMA